jgi:hypothetical protein
MAVSVQKVVILLTESKD